MLVTSKPCVSFTHRVKRPKVQLSSIKWIYFILHPNPEIFIKKTIKPKVPWGQGLGLFSTLPESSTSSLSGTEVILTAHLLTDWLNQVQSFLNTSNYNFIFPHNNLQEWHGCSNICKLEIFLVHYLKERMQYL